MSGRLLSPGDRAHLLGLMRRQTPSTVHRRMNALLLLDDGWAAERVAEALFIDGETVREYRRLFEASGAAGLGQLKYRGAAPALTPEQLEILGAELDARLYATAKAVCAFVSRTFAVTYTPHAMAKVLGRLGFVHKLPKCVPAKADEDAQRKFVGETLAPLMRAANDDTPLYFVDGTHPSYTGHASHGWIRRGETRELKSNHGRVNVNINGALRWPDRTVVHRGAERITSAAMILLFEDLLARHPTSTAIGVVMDNARYNHSRELREWLAGPGARIRPVYLPAYAPNLNLIERFWWLMKKATVYNEYFPTFAGFKAALDGFFANLDRYRGEMESLITNEFHFIGKQKPRVS